MKVLFITRKYPPSNGGMERISYGVISNFPELRNAEVIKWGYSQKGLIFFVPWVFLKSLFILSFKKVDIIHFGDAALSFVGYFLKKIFKIPIVVTAHGLDLTYNNKAYQFMINKTFKDFNKVICISAETKNVVVNEGIKSEDCIVIHNGIDTSKWYILDKKEDLRINLEKKIHRNLKEEFLLLSVGRLVERKGLYWFIQNVFPKLNKNCIFLIAGSGKEEQKLKYLIKSLRLDNRILMLGKVSDNTLKLLYNSTDIFVMPNIPVKGDMEGFGIVAIEAASCGLPVIASNLEGLKDAIKDGKNGFLINPYDVNGFVATIHKVMKMKNINTFSKKQIEYTHNNYDLKNISYKYYTFFNSILKK